jgi:hypothetical protein
VKDVSHRSGHGYRLVALDANSDTTAKVEIKVGVLDRNIGTLQSDGSVIIRSGTATGFASFGPYLGLAPGKYSATLEFSSEKADHLGEFQVFNDYSGAITRVKITNLSGGHSKARIEFFVSGTDRTWQLRTLYEGKIQVIFHSVILNKLT